MFDFLMELAYTRRSNRTFEYNHFQHEMRRPPTIYDSPKNAERIKKTYWNIISKIKIKSLFYPITNPHNT